MPLHFLRYRRFWAATRSGCLVRYLALAARRRARRWASLARSSASSSLLSSLSSLAGRVSVASSSLLSSLDGRVVVASSSGCRRHCRRLVDEAWRGVWYVLCEASGEGGGAGGGVRGRLNSYLQYSQQKSRPSMNQPVVN